MTNKKIHYLQVIKEVLQRKLGLNEQAFSCGRQGREWNSAKEIANLSRHGSTKEQGTFDELTACKQSDIAET